jgi:tetratricopeptide (TPR) repeat protein
MSTSRHGSGGRHPFIRCRRATGRRASFILSAALATICASTHSLAAQVSDQRKDRGDDDPLAEIRNSLPSDPTGARIALIEILWEAVGKVGSAELMLVRSMEDADSARSVEQRGVEQRRRASATVEARRILVALMDTIVFETSWGEAELWRLRRRFPTSAFFLRYEAEVRKRQGEYDDALAIYDRLLGARPALAELLRERAALLELLGRAGDAIDAYTRALEIEPEDVTAFHALVRLRQENGTLPALLEQVRRLRAIYPDTPGLAERETEILHRLGRVALFSMSPGALS